MYIKFVPLGKVAQTNGLSRTCHIFRRTGLWVWDACMCKPRISPNVECFICVTSGTKCNCNNNVNILCFLQKFTNITSRYLSHGYVSKKSIQCVHPIWGAYCFCATWILLWLHLKASKSCWSYLMVWPYDFLYLNMMIVHL